MFGRWFRRASKRLSSAVASPKPRRLICEPLEDRRLLAINSAPTDILLPLNTVLEHQPPNTPVGMFASADPDQWSSFTYSLVPGPGDTDNGSFTIDSIGDLLTASTFDNATKSSYSIRVRSTDQGGLWTEKAFTVTVSPVGVRQVDLASAAMLSSTPDLGSSCSGGFNNGRCVSGDGRYVVLCSKASNLVSGATNGQTQIYVRDLATGTTTRVSTDSAGNEGDSYSNNPCISNDGRYVAFESYASNLVAGLAAGGYHIFVKDLTTGITTLASSDGAGNPGNRGSREPAISGDGRYVAFNSSSTNLVAGDTNGKEDLFVKDRLTGSVTRIRTDDDGSRISGIFFTPSLSYDGRYVAFCSAASGLVWGDGSNTMDVFVVDLSTNVITLVSRNSAGGQANGGSHSPSLSNDGQRVAFCSGATNLVADDTNGKVDVFVKNLQSGEVSRASTDSSGGQGNNDSQSPCISGDGRYVVFCSNASNFVPGPTNGCMQIYARDLATGTTTRVSTDSAGNQGGFHSWTPSVSNDGGSVVFYSESPLAPLDQNGLGDVFVKLLATGQTVLASPRSFAARPVTGGNGDSSSASTSQDGRYVAFVSIGTNIADGRSDSTDIFVRDLFTGDTVQADTDSAGNKMFGESSAPSICGNGRFVAFRSTAWLVNNDSNGKADIFVKDLVTGATSLASTDSSGGQANGDSSMPDLSDDGRYVTFSSEANNLVSGDTANDDVFVKDLWTGTTTLVSCGGNGVSGNNDSGGSRISGDGRFVVFSSYASNLVPDDTNGMNDIFLKNVATGTITLVSSDSGGIAGNAWSQVPDVSADGRFVVFQSGATNLVPSDTNGSVDIFVKDVLTGKTTRVSTDASGNQANGQSTAARISNNGRYVSFSSSASNLVPGDTNNKDDIFVKDLITGAIVRVSTDTAGNQANGGSAGACISGDGRYLAFDSVATNLHAWDNTATRDVFRVSNSLPASDVALASSSVSENRPIGTTVGSLSVTNPIQGDTFSFSLVSGTGSDDNASFAISGNQLKTAASFDYEAKSSYSVRVRATDQRGIWYEKKISISVINVPEIGAQSVLVGFGGKGTWIWDSPGQWTALHGSTPVWMVSGNLDGDAKPDVIVNFGGSVGIWTYCNAGEWKWLHGLTSSVATMADINGDTRDELILSTSTAGIAGVWAYDATLNTWSGLAGWQAEGFAVGDFDGNGKQDVAVDFGAGKGVWFWNNNTAWQYVHNVNPGWMAAGDLDGNGKTDLAISVTGANDIWARLDSGTWQFIKSMANSTATAADANGDGRAELFISITDPVYAGLWEYSLPASSWKYTTDWRPENLTSADVDGNGKKDIVADFGTNGLWIYKNDATWQWVHSLNPQVMTGTQYGQAAPQAAMSASARGELLLAMLDEFTTDTQNAKRRTKL